MSISIVPGILIAVGFALLVIGLQRIVYFYSRTKLVREDALAEYAKKHSKNDHAYQLHNQTGHAISPANSRIVVHLADGTILE